LQLSILEALQSESQRGGVLLGAAMLDDCLLKLLKGFMIDNAEDKVEKLLSGGPNAPLGTFSARALSAYCLGLISEDEFKDIEVIRTIRNDFAHNLLEISFDNQSIKDRCNNLTTPGIMSSTFELDASGKFLINVSYG
jgi:mannitol operon repressor